MFRLRFLALVPFVLARLAAAFAADAPPAFNDSQPQRYELAARASRIDPRTRPHPEIGFVFEKNGKPADIEKASVDTRVKPQGKLVIWLMGYSQPLFERLNGYGLHAIQVHYANGWFDKLSKIAPPEDDQFLGNIRLEAATGKDFSKAVDIPPPDGMMERAFQFVKWLAKANSPGHWEQFLTDDRQGLRWERVIMAGASHGSTTAARFAKYQRVDRVVLFCGPRDQFESWQALPSATPANRFFAFSHVLDGGWTGHHYDRSWELLKLNDFGPIVNVDDSKPPYSNSRRLITAADVKNDARRAHSSVMPGGAAAKDAAGRFIHEDVWRYLFTHPVEQVGMPVPHDPGCPLDLRAAVGNPAAGKPQASVSHKLRPLIAYVGTFSSPLRDVLPTQVDRPPGNGRGIHIFQVDRNSGAMTAAGVFAVETSPSCLALNTSGTRLYSANETDRVGPDKQGTLSAFSIDSVDGHLTLLNTVSSGGAGPTYVSLHPSGHFLFAANYFGGSVSVLPLVPDGRLSNATDTKIDTGKLGAINASAAPPGSFAVSGHDRTHAHIIQADPSGRFVLHVDLGLDQILVWKFDQRTGLLTPSELPAVSLPAGDGPRHFCFHPNGRWLYSIQEEGSTIARFDYDAGTGRLTARQTVSSLPPGFAGTNFCSEILISSDGRFVYAGNRLHDSIGIFSVGSNGDLVFIGEEWTRGDYPRSFNFDPSGQFLYCCNQRGDNITVFSVNRQTGGLAFTGQYVPVGNPSSIVFLDLAKIDRNWW